MPKYKISESYYYKAIISKTRRAGDIYLCNRIVPGWFYNLIPVDRRRTQTRWYFTLFPETPCRLCDEGILVKLPHNGKRTRIFNVRDIKTYKWSYVDLGVDADKYNRPLGLHFYTGDYHELPKYIKKCLSFIINTYTSENVISKEQAVYLADSKLTERPKKEISHIYKKSFTTIKKRKPIISRKIRRRRLKAKIRKEARPELNILSRIEEIQKRNLKREKKVIRNKKKKEKQNGKL